MVYVPVYDPEIVYGTWRYPNYRPYRYYYSGYSSSSAFSFLAGVPVGAELGWGGWDLDWDHHRSNVRVDNYNTFVRRSYSRPELFQISSSGGTTVTYDTQFRKNAGYKDYTTAQRLGGQQSSNLTTARPSVSGSRVVGQAETRPLVSTTKSRGTAITPRSAASSSMTRGSGPKENQSNSQSSPNVKASNANVASRGSGEVFQGGSSRGGVKSANKAAPKPNGSQNGDKSADKTVTQSDVSQAANTANSEDLKGKDLAEKVHETIDTRKESKDAMNGEAKGKGTK